MKILAFINRFKFIAVGIATSALLNSCDSILDMPKEDCSIEHVVNFKYDRNMKFADAFANEVKSVTVYAFDSDGKFLFQQSEQGNQLSQAGYTMSMPIGKEDIKLVTWAGLQNSPSFSVPTLTPGVSTLNDLTCRLNRKDGSVKDDLQPLFHGMISNYSTTRAAESYITTIPLTKNTNNIRVVLQQMSDKPIGSEEFEFKITDDNGVMNYDNSLLKDEQIVYKPWSKVDGSADIEGSGNTHLNMCVAEFTLARLINGKATRLTITNGKQKTILSIPVIDYVLLVKGNYNKDMDNQEFLDRQDEYNMTFFIDENNAWVSSSIIINGWKVVLNDLDI